MADRIPPPTSAASGTHCTPALYEELYAHSLADPDGFYEAWVAAHEGLTDAESADLDARLVLLLANQVGEMRVLLECIAAARAARG